MFAHSHAPKSILKNTLGLTLIEVMVAGSLTALGSLAMGTVLIKMAQFKNELLIENCMFSVRSRILATTGHFQSWYLTLMYNDGAAFQTANWNGLGLSTSSSFSGAVFGSSGGSLTAPSPTGIILETSGNQVKQVVQLYNNNSTTLTTDGFTAQCTPCLTTSASGTSCIIKLNMAWIVFNAVQTNPQLLTANNAHATLNGDTEDALVRVTGQFSINGASVALYPYLNDLVGPSATYGFEIVRPIE